MSAQQEEDPAAGALAGALSSGLSLALTYPLTTLTTRQQATDTESTRVLTSLYDGMQPAVVTTLVSQWFYFYFYHLFGKLANGAGVEKGAVSSLLLASLAGSVNVLLTNPFWLTVTRMQTRQVVEDGSRKKGFTEALREILSERGGVLALWQGVVPSLVLVSNPAILFMVFESLMARLRKASGGGDVSTKSIFLAGALAKLIATIITFPMLVIKTRLQSKPTSMTASNERSRTSDSTASVLSVVHHIILENGATPWAVLGFYKGLQAKLVQTVLNAALMFVMRDRMTPAAITLLAAVRNLSKTTPAK